LSVGCSCIYQSETLGVNLGHPLLGSFWCPLDPHLLGRGTLPSWVLLHPPKRGDGGEDPQDFQSSSHSSKLLPMLFSLPSRVCGLIRVLTLWKIKWRDLYHLDIDLVVLNFLRMSLRPSSGVKSKSSNVTYTTAPFYERVTPRVLYCRNPVSPIYLLWDSSCTFIIYCGTSPRIH
jgi:hypothetical protein